MGSRNVYKPFGFFSICQLPSVYIYFNTSTPPPSFSNTTLVEGSLTLYFLCDLVLSTFFSFSIK